MTHCMLDLETWGTTPGCAIRSIGAVIFDPFGSGFGEEFYVNIDPASCAQAGLTIDPRTAEWWESQSPDARKHLQGARLSLLQAADNFLRFWYENGAVFVWGHGATFDPPILEAAFHAVGAHSIPWKFWNIRDTRTLFDLSGVSLKDVPREGTHHNALDDAKHQAVAAHLAYRKLGFV